MVEAKFSIGDETHEAGGVGYHDHNWGNVGLPDIIHDWYWARGQARPYSTITSFITSHKNYGYAELPIFMLARDGQIIAGDASKVTFERENVYTDTTTGKPVAGVTRYIYEDGDDRYIVTFTRRQDLARDRMIESIHGLKRLAATLAGFDGAYSASPANAVCRYSALARSSKNTRTGRSGSSCTSDMRAERDGCAVDN
jgi:hypothetical protein